MNKSKLKPCPFCGWHKPFLCTSRYGDIQELHYHVHCGHCGSLGGHDSDKNKAITAWNTRKPMDNIMEQLEDWLNATGCIPKRTSYYHELLSIVRNAGKEGAEC